MKMLTSCLDGIADDVLLTRVAELVGRSRRVEAELVRHLAEVDRRRLYLREACPSMHVYATTRLHLSDAEAYLRITAARLSRRFPVVLAMLAEGKLHLTAIAKLAPHLVEDNVDALLARAAHRSKREIELLVAELAPQPDVPSRIRRLPASMNARAAVGADLPRPDGVSIRAVTDRPATMSAAGDRAAIGRDPASLAAPASTVRPSGHATTAMSIGSAATADSVAPSVGVPSAATRLAGSDATAAGALAATPLAASATAAGALAANARSQVVMAPVAPSRYRVQFTASGELHDKIERARALLRHQIPDGDLVALFDRAMTLLVRELERARFAATAAPRKAAHEADPTPSSRRIPDPVRRTVWTRDEAQCTFRDRKGRRCPARDRLQFHHLTPFALGGDHSPSNVTLRCAGHNAYQAVLDFGAAFMAARRGSTRASETGSPTA